MNAQRDELVEFMLAEPGLLDRLLVQHVDDGAGCCRTCGGPQSGRHRFPCDVRRAADRAAGVRAERDRDES